ncbi:hypothetical protein ACFV0T_35565 [Streptomyces sp. NPDC059582]|uniref:hypothetical protein n=1 Tax=Streptomyces sp. NPDC059582 TaxID=3346875 RepID=UPI0036B3AC6D
MSGWPFSFAHAEATFGPECAALEERERREAPRFTPEHDEFAREMDADEIEEQSGA